MNGFVLIDKPEGWTSRDVCNKIRHLLNVEKSGHTGTLDPFATGLLIISLNKATKAGIYLENDDKEYETELILGKKTMTGDKTSEVIETCDVPLFNEEDIKEVFETFIGKQEQIPPMTSAIHYNGVKLYELAHKGIEVERKARNIEIKKLELLGFSQNAIRFRCLVSKGTYIRVLAEDIAKKLNTVGYLSSLRRVGVGTFRIEDAKPLMEVKSSDVFSIRSALNRYLPEYKLEVSQDKRVYDGASMRILNIAQDRILMISSKEEAIAIYGRKENDDFVCLRGLW